MKIVVYIESLLDDRFTFKTSQNELYSTIAWVPGEMGRQPISRINQSWRTPCQLVSSIRYLCFVCRGIVKKLMIISTMKAFRQNISFTESNVIIVRFHDMWHIKRDELHLYFPWYSLKIYCIRLYLSLRELCFR